MNNQPIERIENSFVFSFCRRENSSAPSSDCEMHYSEEATFYSTAVSNVCTALCVLTSENRLLTVMHLTI